MIDVSPGHTIKQHRIIEVALFYQQSVFKICDYSNGVSIDVVIEPSAIFLCNFNVNCFQSVLRCVANGHLHCLRGISLSNAGVYVVSNCLALTETVSLYVDNNRMVNNPVNRGYSH